MLISRVAHRGGRHRWRSSCKDSRKGGGGGKRVGGRDLVGEKIEVPEETLPRSHIHRRSFLPKRWPRWIRPLKDTYSVNDTS
ncbi:hypothetical protein IG631_14363 [Alternaria alternata]|nr:hypothetical protein IG631_14363 [Alternaria alternata]